MEGRDHSPPEERGHPQPGLAAAAVRAISTLPRVSRAGVLAIAIGLLLDVTYHAGSHTTSLEVPCCGVGFVGHLLTLTGMILVLVGVVTTAFRHDRRPNEPEERR